MSRESGPFLFDSLTLGACFEYVDEDLIVSCWDCCRREEPMTGSLTQLGNVPNTIQGTSEKIKSLNIIQTLILVG